MRRFPFWQTVIALVALMTLGASAFAGAADILVAGRPLEGGSLAGAKVEGGMVAGMLAGLAHLDAANRLRGAELRARNVLEKAEKRAAASRALRRVIAGRIAGNAAFLAVEAGAVALMIDGARGIASEVKMQKVKGRAPAVVVNPAEEVEYAKKAE